MGLMVAMVVGIFVVPVVLLVFVQMGRAKRHRQRQLKSWGAVAEARGGRLAVSEDRFGHHTLTVPVNGHDVRVTVVDGEAVDRSIAKRFETVGGWHTVVEAACLGQGARFSLRKRGLLGAGVTQAIGDDAFRRRFAFELAEGAVAASWNERAVGLAKRLDPATWVACGGSLVTAIRPGVVLDRKHIETAIDLVAELARPLDRVAHMV